MIALAIILGVLLLILLLPVGAMLRYDGEITLKVIVGPLRIGILPGKPKSRKQLEKEEKKKAQKEAAKAEKKKKAAANKLIKKEEKPKPKEPLKDKLAGLIPFIKLATDAFGSIFRKLTVTKLVLHVSYGGSDKAKLAESYGTIMGAVGAVGPLLGKAFRVKRREISIVPDFLSDQVDILAELHLRYFVFDLLGILLKYGWRGLKLLLARKKHEKTLLEQQQGSDGHTKQLLQEKAV